MHETLGEGSYAEVRRATTLLANNLRSYAIKIVDKKRLRRIRHFSRDESGKLIVKDGMINVYQEVSIMKKLRHPNIISLHEVIDDSENHMLYIVLDYAEKGEAITWDEEEEVFTTDRR